ncbi:MAG: hypothetical protein MHM6MM_004782 [Cercozoa sp. M6MM]
MSRRLSKQLSLRAGELDEMRAEWFQFDADTTRRFSAAAAIITTALPPLLRKIEASDETPQDVSDKVHRHTLRLHEHVVALRDLLADLDGIQLRMRQLQALWHEDVSQADLPVQELATPSTERAAPCEQVRLLDDVVVRHDEEYSAISYTHWREDANLSRTCTLRAIPTRRRDD